MFAQSAWILGILISWVIQLSDSRVYEGKNLVKFVGYKKFPTVLHASAGFGSTKSPLESEEIKPAFRIRSNAAQLYKKPEKSIDPNFIIGASLFEQRPHFQDRILTKPKRWAISTVYDHPNHQKADSNFVMDAPKLIEKRTYPDEYGIREEVNQTEYDVLEYRPEMQPSTYDSPPRRAEADMYTPQEMYPAENERSDMEEYPTYYVKEDTTEPEHVIFRSPSPWATRYDSPRLMACKQRLDRGVGPDEISSWYFDLDEHRCRWFGYRGYGGNANRFFSRSACENYCIQDIEDLCTTVSCSWRNTHCNLVGDQRCKKSKESYGEDWRIGCPPDQPVCVSRLNTRMAPDVSSKSLPTECYQAKNSGSCVRKNPFIRYYYDQKRNNCMQFYFHGCGGNDNRFETKSDCMTHCAP